MLIFVVAAGLLFVFLRIAKDPLLPTNMLALDLVSHQISSLDRFDKEVTRKNSELMLATARTEALRLASAWSCEFGYFSTCERGYREALRRSPSNPLAAFFLANHLATRGQEEEATDLWRQAGSGRYWAYVGQTQPGCICERLDGGMCLLQRAASIAPEDGVVQYLLGQRLVECRLWAEATEALSAALDSGELNQTERFDVLLDRGVASYHAGLRLIAAETDLVAASQLQPGNPWPWLRRCTLYRMEGNYPEAAGFCSEAIRLAPDLGFAYYYRGRVWQEAMDLERATADYVQSLLLDPTLTAARNRLEQIQP
jgi:tetratricopeptide (TPR) repeat protein